MIRLNAFSMGHLVADVAEDIWHTRHKLLSSELPIAYFPFRLSVSDYTDDVDVNFYVHFVVTRERWYYTINDKAPFDGGHEEYIFSTGGIFSEPDVVDPDPDVQGESYRHYAFSDLMSGAIEKKIEAVRAGLGKPEETANLWSFFPLEEFRVNGGSAHKRVAIQEALSAFAA